jgi:hypothetical protein
MFISNRVFFSSRIYAELTIGTNGCFILMLNTLQVNRHYIQMAHSSEWQTEKSNTGILYDVGYMIQWEAISY